MKIFITGGTGLVGTHTVRALKARGDSILGLSRSTAGDDVLRAMGAEPLRGDLADDAAIARGTESCDAVVHTGAIVLSRGDWARFHAVNVAPTEMIARACARTGRRLVHISSVAVYGRATTYDGGEASVTEEFGMDAPVFPGDHYARSKREAELALWRVARERELSAVALRPCVIYGEGDRTFAIRVARVMRRGIVPAIGDGENTLSIVYAGNVAAAVVAALDHPDVTGAFNICNDGDITQREFLARFAGGLGVTPRQVRIPKMLAWRAATIADAILSRVTRASPMTMMKPAVQFLASPNPFVSGKATRELAWRPVTPAAEAVERTGRWFKDHP